MQPFLFLEAVVTCRSYRNSIMLFLCNLWQKIWYINGIKTTIDKAGRVVIPAAVRERAGLKPGTELDVFVDDISIRLVASAPEPVLLRRGRRLIAKPAAKAEDLPKIDLAAMVEEERNRWPW